MPIPSSRIPGLGGRKKSFLTPPSAGLARAQESGARPARTPSPGLQRPTKRLQFPATHTSNQIQEQETQIQAKTPPKVPRPLSSPAPSASSFVPSNNSDTQSDNIRVLLRIRPSPGKDSKKALEVAPDQRGVTLAPSSQQEKRFGFDRVFTESCEQDDIFQDAGRAAVENTIQGYNGSIFAYGQTGSGKTFTMLGGTTANAHELRLSPLRGLTPRILDYLFLRLAALSRDRNAAFYSGEEQERALQYTLVCSYLEIYNEKIFDLLEPTGSVAAQQPKSLREDRNKEVYVDQLREIDIEKLLQEIATLRSSVGTISSIPQDSSDPSKSEHLLRLKAIAEAEAEAQAQEKKKQNRWEPALDMMQKLLRASGAMAPVDIAEENGEEPQQQERDVVEVRCDRLEMLLYRMICRFEEYKEVTFDPDRYKYSRRPHQLKPSKLQAPRMSMLPTPKRYSSAAARYHHVDNQEHSADDDETAAALAAAEKRERELHKKVQEQQNRVEELLRRSQEAEAENDLIRHELCELLEWKAFVEEERRRVSDAVPMDPQQESEEDELETPILEASTVPSEEMQEMQEMLNVYRSLFDEVTELMYTKKPVLCSPPSPKSGSSVVTDSNSTSYASGDEDEAGDDCMSMDGFDASEDGDGGVSDTYREIRRVNALSSRLGRKLDLYQDTIQRLEKELQTTQDELETSSAATKFAEFQLQQLRTLAADEETKQTQAENELREKLEQLEQTVRSQRDEMAQVLDEKAAEDARALEHEQNAARREVERLEHSLRNSSESGDDENDKQQLANALQAAQKRIDDLEREMEASQATVAAPEMKATSAETPVQLQTLLNRALEDNAKLLETVRDLQGKRQRSGANLQLLSSLLAAAAGDEKNAENASEDSKADELTRLRREIATLRLQRSGSDISDLSAIGVDTGALAKPTETIQRLALERATLRSRLHQAQQTTARLEKEMRRVHRNAAVDSSNGALSTEFLCGI
ncbi:hypothetical protein PC117_g2151 [Phytophthora cactorum]|uniref:Kinesin motor domain-containing protein n=1 Tax=Phytophthora cactorum TaxID=29920 RepID=A0A8T1EFR3_9STRA|nr:hypothetical protein PC117_g2151 [Phytophthora cactorum]